MLTEIIKQKLENLNRIEYLVVCLYFVEGLTVEEIEYVLGIEKSKIERTVKEITSLYL